MRAEHSYRRHPNGVVQIYAGEIQVTEIICDLGFFQVVRNKAITSCFQT